MSRFIFTVLLAGMLTANAAQAVQYQWSVPMPQSKSGERRAYLWIPPSCQRVHGLLIGLQNMLEKNMFEDPIIRRAAEDSKLGIVWIAPGTEGKDTPLGLEFAPRDQALTVLHETLKSLAEESGYGEVEFAPLLVVGHSAATPFVWGMAEAEPSRVVAIIPIKGWYPAHVPAGVPVFRIAQEWAEWGDKWGENWSGERQSAMRLRADGKDRLIGEFLDAGAGHFDWTPESAPVIAMFIRKAAQYRIPDTVPVDAPVALKPVDFESGCVIDAMKLGTDGGTAVAARDWKKQTESCLWYFDCELAEAVNRYGMERLSKKPQMIDFVVNHHPLPLVKNGFAEITPEFMADGVTFKVAATYIEKSPTTNLFNGGALSHSSAPIHFRVASGGLRQTGPDTFKVAIDRGSVARQGPPWEPWVMAYQAGDGEFRPTDRPAHISIKTRLTEGQPQTVLFADIPDMKIGTNMTLTLNAVSDAGLPVQYFVISGPVDLEGDKLTVTDIPPRAKFPIRVTVAAYQWGRATNSKVRSAGPVVRSFLILK